MANHDPSLWWLNWELPAHRHESVLSIVKVRDFWVLTTEYAVFCLDVGHAGEPRVQMISEILR